MCIFESCLNKQTGNAFSLIDQISTCYDVMKTAAEYFKKPLPFLLLKEAINAKIVHVKQNTPFSKKENYAKCIFTTTEIPERIIYLNKHYRKQFDMYSFVSLS